MLNKAILHRTSKLVLDLLIGGAYTETRYCRR